MNLIVFETNQLESEYALKNDCIWNEEVDLGSIARGAGSVSCTLKKGEVYETVLFIKHDYFEGKYDDFAVKLNQFIKDLHKYKMIDGTTKLI